MSQVEHIDLEGKEAHIESSLPEYIGGNSMLPYQWYCLPGGNGICIVPDYHFPNEKPIGYSGKYGIFICDVIPENKFINHVKMEHDAALLRKRIINVDQEQEKELLVSFLLKLEEQEDKKTIGMTKSLEDSLQKLQFKLLCAGKASTDGTIK